MNAVRFARSRRSADGSQRRGGWSLTTATYRGPDLRHPPARTTIVNRREFIGTGLLALPALGGCDPRRSAAAARVAPPVALATADTESHIAVVAMASGRVVQRVRTIEGPRSIQGRAGVVAGCAP